MAINFTLNSIIFNNEIKELSYTDYNKECTTYDKELITDFFQKKGLKLGPHNLIIFHLNGQHRPANSQYPQEKAYQVFSAKDIKNPASYLNDESRQRIAEYDNATFYNDQVIRHITDFIKDKNALLIYFSDHGEEVYDYRDFLGRSLLEETEVTPELIKYQMEIPFIVWCSKKWKQLHEREWNSIGECIDREFSIDNTCHLLFYLGGVNTKEYNPKRDLLNPEFVPQTKEYDMWNIL
jgi:heptose-I-phosphate ethanolaminephosphotransferase